MGNKLEITPWATSYITSIVMTLSGMNVPVVFQPDSNLLVSAHIQYLVLSKGAEPFTAIAEFTASELTPQCHSYCLL